MEIDVFQFLNLGNLTLLLVALGGFVTLTRIVYLVPQSQNFIVERLGRFHRVLKPGLNLLVPFVDRVAHRISVLERQSPECRVSVFTQDNVEVAIVSVVYWRVVDPELSVYRIENVDNAIIVATTSIVRNTGAGLELDNLQASREQINSDIQRKLGEASGAWGIAITRTEVVDIVLDERTKQAQRQQVEAERARRAQVTTAEGQARAKELTADAILYESKQQSEAVVLAAEARAKEISLVARAQAEEIELVGQAMRDYGEAPAVFELRKRQVLAIEKMASSPSSRLMVLPTDVTQILGGIGAFAEGLGAFGNGNNAANGRPPASGTAPQEGEGERA